MKLKKLKISATPQLSFSSTERKPLYIAELPPALRNNLAYQYRPSIMAVDTEGTGLHWAGKSKVFSLQVSYKNSLAEKATHNIYFEWSVNPETKQPEIKKDMEFTKFVRYYTDPSVIKVFANKKYDMHMIEESFYITPVGPCYDVITAAWICNTLEEGYSLKALRKKYLDIGNQDEIELKKATQACLKKYRKEYPENSNGHYTNYYWLLRHYDRNDDRCKIYGLNDSDSTLDLWFFYKQALEDLELWEHFEFRTKVDKVLYKMENRGVRFFRDECLKAKEILLEKQRGIEFDLKSYFGKPELNLNSPKQLIEILFNETNGLIFPLTPKQWTPKGDPSTKTEALKSYEDIEQVEWIMRYRGYKKAIENCDNYLREAVPEKAVGTGIEDMAKNPSRIHTTFNQIASTEEGKTYGTRTGRLSSNNPNLTNVSDPKKSSGQFVYDTRKFFGPRPSYSWYCIDYNQIEARIFAEKCGGRLKQAYLEGRDMHEETRSSIPYLSDMNPERGRKLAKNTNYTILNCGGVKVLNDRYGVPIKEGKIIYDQLFKEFPEIRKTQRSLEKQAIQKGYIETITGRRIHLDRAQKGGRYLYTYRAISCYIQGSAADIMLQGLVNCQDYIDSFNHDEKRKFWAYIVLAVHDEIVFEIYKKHCFKGRLRKICSIMSDVKDLMEIPIPVEINKTTKTWSSDDKIEIKL